MKKLLFLGIVFLLILQFSFAEGIDVPLITDNAGSMIKRDFEIHMLNLPKNPREDVYGSLTFGIGRFEGGLWCVMLGGVSFLRITNWLHLPLFIGIAGNDATDYDDISGYIGSGFLVRNEYFSLGVKGGIGTYPIIGESNLYAFDDDFKVYFDYGIYPSLNTSQFTFLRYLETIEGYLVPKDPSVEVDNFGYFAYGLQFLFKGLIGLPIFDLYTDGGTNKFMFGYDFSSFPMVIKPKGGGSRGYVLEYGSISNNIGNIYNTVSYGMRIGYGDNVDGYNVFDLNILMLDDPFEYDYPYKLFGFPSITYSVFNSVDGGDFFHGETITVGMYARFSTLNFTGRPYLPDLGTYANVGLMSWNLMFSFPFTLTFSMRHSFKYQ